MSTPTIVTGDHTSIAVTLKVNGSALAIGSGAVVKAKLVSSGHTIDYSEAVTQSNLTSGSNWAAGLVVVEFAVSDTADITYQGPALLEIQVDEASKPRTWFVPVKIVTGRIS